MKSLLLLALCALSIGAKQLDLTGRVSATDGRPITGATAYIYTAGPKVGTSSYCPSCYADCGKSAVTDAKGEFKILSLDSDLKFRVLFVAEGYKPAFADNVDPVAGKRVEARLASMPKIVDPARVLKGRVVDSRGEPVLGAMVTPEGCKTTGRRWWGAMPGVDAMSVTNARGEFLITSERPAIAFDLKVEARSLATQNFELLPLGNTPHELKLGEGATVLGRLLKDGKPVVGAAIGMVQENRGVGHFTGPRTIGTDTEGRFAFFNVAPAGDWNVYGIMSGMQGGGVTSRSVRVDGENTTSDAGDLSVGPSYKISGRVVLADGHTIPPSSRLQLGRESAWDSQIVVLDSAGNFEVAGVPAEPIRLSASVKGYHLSAENRSLDRLNLGSLVGKVNGNISNLTILLEPGRVEPLNDLASRREASDKTREAWKAPIEGVSR